jgi:uncharacterized protein YjbI with pentapeptide repeats
VFPEDVDFRQEEFRGPDFRDAVFMGTANFYDARFPVGANFCGAVFVGKANFTKSQFSARNRETEARFCWARFHQEADFSEVRFYGNARFDRGVVATDGTGEVLIGQSTMFVGPAYFTRAEFHGAADFRAADFCAGASFARAQFGGAVSFVGDGETWVFGKKKEAETHFESVIFEAPTRVAFEHVFLGHALFAGTDVRHVDFTDVKWARRAFWEKPVPCSVVWDELRREGKGEQKDYERIRKLYQQLKENYEEQRDPITAGDFHFGEMEMRRLGPREDKRFPFFLFLYRWISGYGEDYILPLVWIGVVLVVFALAFAYVPSLALRPSAGSTAAAISGGFWERLEKTFLYYVMCFLLRPEKHYQPVYDLGRYLSLAEGIIGPVLIAMFTLALNRRFKR